MKPAFLLTVALLAALARKHPINQKPGIPLLGRQRELHPKIRYAGVCDHNPPEVQLYNTTIKNMGTKTVVNAFVSTTRQINAMTEAVVNIRRCNSEEDEYSCEFFHTWRFGNETCQMLEMKNQIWSAIFLSVHPPLKCPIKRGLYRIENATLDVSSVKAVFFAYPIEKYFWRVQIDAYDYKLFTCIIFGLSFVR